MVIAACGKSFHWSRSLSVATAFPLQRLDPTASTVGGLLTGLERGNHWVAALGLLSLTRELPSLLYGPKGGEVSVTWNAGMAACASSEAWQWAMHLVEGEPWRGLSSKAVGTAGYNTVLSALAASDNWVVALQLLRELLHSGVRMDTASCCTAIGALLRETALL
eukprot:symbB.v1.2.028789.t1/scaffold3084.1/size64054/5